jgi:protein-S-isoprenylcysteine O-methyltransferase Ste14
MNRLLIQAGRFLYTYRAWIAVPFFILLVVFSRPDHIKTIPYISVFIGLFIRLWAAGFIGIKARQREFSTGCRIINAPYKYLKHPLYLGNFFLVLGIVLLFNPRSCIALLIIGMFVLIYTLIIVAEDDYLKNMPESKAKFTWMNCRGEISTVMVIIIIIIIYNIMI